MALVGPLLAASCMARPVPPPHAGDADMTLTIDETPLTWHYETETLPDGTTLRRPVFDDPDALRRWLDADDVPRCECGCSCCGVAQS